MEQRNAARNRGNKKSEIVRYIFKHNNASKSEIAKELNLSMPTVLQNTKELIEQGILVEGGEYESTGGRRAKSLALNGDAMYAVGMDIATDHINLVLINFTGEILKHACKRINFCNSFDYYRELSEELNRFLQIEGLETGRIVGLGVTLPGIIDNEGKMLIKSHSLNLEGVSLKIIERFMPYPVYFENDANAAMIVEQEKMQGDATYLFISNTIGGAFRIQGSLFCGNNRKAGEFGHMVIVPNGKECFCGKRGCVNSYCSVDALKKASGLQLEQFMNKVAEKDPEILKIWDEYLEYLAITVANLRMMYDTDIILGGDMGEYLDTYMLEFGKKVMKYNKFDSDISYLRNSDCKRGNAAAGAAMHFIYQYIDKIC